tara:strand:- start:1874 stop:3349 length:1476 start_codon:yes stop_codon:yes gene_type:complete
MNISTNYKKFYHNILNNFAYKNCFYKNYQEVYSYNQCAKYAINLIYFFKKNKIKKNSVICTYSNKSFEMYSSIFPILISNYTWVPLSSSYPKEKIKEIVKKVKPSFILCDRELMPNIIFFKKNKCCFDEIENNQDISKKNFNILNNKINKINVNDTALIYFTSGSTGESKGICISHKNIIADTFAQIYHLHSKRGGLIFGDYYDTAFSIFFDIYFPAIFLGSCISPATKVADTYLPLKHIEENGVNTLILVPSTVQRIKEYYGNKIKLKINTLILTGEPFFLDLLKFIFKKIKFKNLFNCYGGTEMSNWVFFHKCKKTDIKKFSKYNLVPIGKNFANLKYKIINKELIVTGPMISKGYLDKNLNSNFVFSKNNTFHTSDQVIKYKNNLICRGRNDKMIKIRGYRVDLSDVELNIRKLRSTKQCLVFERKKKKYQNYICAAIETSDKNEENIRNQLKKKIASYMIPLKIKIFKKFPNNSNGKIDRKKIISEF